MIQSTLPFIKKKPQPIKTTNTLNIWTWNINCIKKKSITSQSITPKTQH